MWISGHLAPAVILWIGILMPASLQAREGLGVGTEVFTSGIEQLGPFVSIKEDRAPSTRVPCLSIDIPPAPATKFSFLFLGPSHDIHAARLTCYSQDEAVARVAPQIAYLCGQLMMLLLKTALPDWDDAFVWLLGAMAKAEAKESASVKSNPAIDSDGSHVRVVVEGSRSFRTVTYTNIGNSQTELRVESGAPAMANSASKRLEGCVTTP